MTTPRFLALHRRRPLSPAEMRRRARAFRRAMRDRRSVRHFSDRPVDRAVIEECLRAAGAAPSGANLQPWHFVVVSDADLKRRIRAGAEAEERRFYGGRASREWLAALEPLGTDENKPFLEAAPYLIVVFAERYRRRPGGGIVRHYYVLESVGIATGFLITALHLSGLATLTHTPSPMKFLNRILGRPDNESPFLILVVGHPAAGARVPDIGKRDLDDFTSFV